MSQHDEESDEWKIQRKHSWENFLDGQAHSVSLAHVRQLDLSIKSFQQQLLAEARRRGYAIETRTIRMRGRVVGLKMRPKPAKPATSGRPTGHVASDVDRDDGSHSRRGMQAAAAHG
jgi:hypothetical protein